MDILKEHIAVAEAKKLNIPTFAIVDTNSDPNAVDYAIPANDDASKSIAIIVKAMCDAIQVGLNERALDKDKVEEEAEEEVAEDKKEEEAAPRTGRRKRINEGENASERQPRRNVRK